MQLILIGETAKKISDETKANIDLPWYEISAFRNHAVHDYYNLDVDIVWNTIKEDMPILKEKINEYLASND